MMIEGNEKERFVDVVVRGCHYSFPGVDALAADAASKTVLLQIRKSESSNDLHQQR